MIAPCWTPRLAAVPRAPAHARTAAASVGTSIDAAISEVLGRRVPAVAHPDDQSRDGHIHAHGHDLEAARLIGRAASRGGEDHQEHLGEVAGERPDAPAGDEAAVGVECCCVVVDRSSGGWGVSTRYTR